MVAIVHLRNICSRFSIRNPIELLYQKSANTPGWKTLCKKL